MLLGGVARKCNLPVAPPCSFWRLAGDAGVHGAAMQVGRSVQLHAITSFCTLEEN